MNADTAEGFEPVMELHASEGPLRSLTILRGQQPHNDQRRQIQVSVQHHWSVFPQEIFYRV